MNKELLVVRCSINLKPAQFDGLKEYIEIERTTGSILLPHYCEAIVVPKDIEVKIENTEKKSKGYNPVQNLMEHPAIEALHDFEEHMKKVWNDPAFQEELKRKRIQWEQEIADAKNALKPLIKVGDLIRVQDCHHEQICTYEVASIESNGPVSQPAHYSHNWVDIVAVYRFDEISYMYNLIWRK